MKSFRIDFFAARDDMRPPLEAFEAANKVRYVCSGMFTTPDIPTYASVHMLPDLGVATFGDRNHEKSYLLIGEGVELAVEQVPQKDGTMCYCVDLISNPTAFALRPAGVFGDRYVIDGTAGTATGDPTSLELCRTLAREIRKRFTKIRSYHVGPEALRLLDEGWHLTPSTQTPERFDLKRDA